MIWKINIQRSSIKSLLRKRVHSLSNLKYNLIDNLKLSFIQPKLSKNISQDHFDRLIKTIIYKKIEDAHLSEKINQMSDFSFGSMLKKDINKMTAYLPAYESDSEEYEMAYKAMYEEAVQKQLLEIQVLPLELIHDYVLNNDHMAEKAEDLIFFKEESKNQEDLSSKDINFAIEKIRNLFSNLQPQKLIDILYDWMISHQQSRKMYDYQTLYSPYCKYNFSDMRKKKYEILNFDKKKQQALVVYEKVVRNEKGVFLTNHGLLKKETFEERYQACKTTEDFRENQRELGVRAFCKFGYGIPKLRMYQKAYNTSLQIRDRRYKSVSTGFVTFAWRKIQNFLIEDCHKPLKVANSMQVKVLYTILLNIRQFFEVSQTLTFIKYLQLTYSIAEVQITEEETFKLYTSIMAALHKKIKQERYNKEQAIFEIPKNSQSVTMAYYKPNYEDLWTKELTIEFYDAYLKERSIIGVRKHFQSHYSLARVDKDEAMKKKINQLNKMMLYGYQSKQNCLTAPPDSDTSFYKYITSVKNLNGHLQKVIRAGIKRIQLYSVQNMTTLPRLNRLNDQKIKGLFGSSYGLNARIGIIYVQRMAEEGNYDPQTVTFAINALNDYNQKKTREKEFQQSQQASY